MKVKFKSKIFFIGLPLLAFLIPFVVYLLTLMPTVGPADSTEMTTAAITLGIPHHSSYPLNTLIGHLFSKLPIPKPATWKVNLAAATLQATTVLIFFFLVKELVGEAGKDRHGKSASLIAFGASLFLAFNLIFWQYALKFEVFELNNLLAVLMLLVAVKIRYQNERQLHLLWPLLAFLAGLGIAHHQTIVLIFPAIVILLADYFRDLAIFIWEYLLFLLRDIPLKTRSYFNIKNLTIFTVAFIIGILSIFLLMPIAWRDPAMNWGEPKNIEGAVAALMRRDSGGLQPFVTSEQSAKLTAVDQTFFYLQYIILDFTIVGVVLIVVGILFLWKNSKEILIFSALGAFFAGPFFFAFANFPIGDTFAKATLRRFDMLPHIFLSIFLAFGLYFFFNLLENFKAQTNQNLEVATGFTLGQILLLTSFLFALLVNFAKVNESDNTLTADYARQAYAGTEDNALILLSGDIPDMTADYFRYVVAKNQDHRVVFTPGQFHLAWFIPQLLRRYPDLVIPFAQSGKKYTTATQVIEANWGKRPIYVGPDLVEKDPQLAQQYTLWPKNLLFLVKQPKESLNLETYRQQNDLLWRQVNLDLIQKLSKRTPSFEDSIIFYYARHFFNTGSVFEKVQLYDDAISQYKRVLEIDPYFKEALGGLGRIYGFELESPDYDKAIDYLQKFQSVLTSDEADKIQGAQELISQLRQNKIKSIEDVIKREATPSAKQSQKSK